MATRILINGMGRIGRAAFKILMDTPELELVAVNDIADPANIAYLLKYDTVYGRYNRTVELDGNDLVIDGERRIRFLQERDPSQLPWKEMNVEIVFESTGVFTKREDLQKHAEAGAKWVILSAPAKDKDFPTVVHGVNWPDGGVNILSCASCTTNATAPVMEILDRRRRKGPHDNHSRLHFIAGDCGQPREEVAAWPCGRGELRADDHRRGSRGIEGAAAA